MPNQHESEDQLLQRAREALSRCNWEIGECAAKWTERYARGRTDADFGGQHVEFNFGTDNAKRPDRRLARIGVPRAVSLNHVARQALHQRFQRKRLNVVIIADDVAVLDR